MQRRSLLSLGLLAGCATPPPPVQQAAVVVVPPPADTRLLYCVPYARERSGIDLSGDGWQWWEAAAGRYARGQQPQTGAVLVFRQTPRLVDGHVAVVTRILSVREIRVDHANWVSRHGGGPISLDQQVVDVSANNDWTEVRVWYPPSDLLGTTVFPTSGFVLPRAPTAATTQS
jgi:surface antigen